MCTPTCTQISMAALFQTAKTYNQPRYLSVGEWNSKMWQPQTMEQYSAIKKKLTINHEKTWKNLKCVLLVNYDTVFKIQKLIFLKNTMRVFCCDM